MHVKSPLRLRISSTISLLLVVQSLLRNLLDLCCCADAARFRQLAEEARKQKQAKRQARKERKRPAAAKPQDEAAARLAEHRAKVMKQERELHRAKAEQQKAELAAKRRLLLQRDRALRQDPGHGTCDPDEGNAHSDAQHDQVFFVLGLHHRGHLNQGPGVPSCKRLDHQRCCLSVKRSLFITCRVCLLCTAEVT